MPFIAEPAEGPAFSVSAKVIATALLAVMLWTAASAAPQVAAHRWSPPQLLLGLVAMAALGLGYYWILRSRTGIDHTHIRQTWLWPKVVAIADVTEAKFIYVPFVAWLITPRLVVRVRGQGKVVFHAADPRVLAAFARLSLGQPV
ncbi:MAG TPA: hypothetical protein VF169_27590 [Albitalea sp.]|uniref:hypothetical protein n=1 Tax=Piscinibacter sp. TaxID=1903157 RepID=UPI002ED13C17